jgi:PAS domain S-box-containing protein
MNNKIQIPNTQPLLPHILLVDDDRSILRTISPFLESNGYQVTTSESGEYAIELLKKGSFDIIITDLVMETIDGFQILKRAKKQYQETMVIIFTGYSDITLVIDALRIGADDYLLKPCEPEVMLFRVKSCLEKKDTINKITEAKAALRESEERFRTLFEEAPIPIQGHGPDGTIHYWNRACENIYGYKKEEAVGKNIIELIIPPEMHDYVRKTINRSVETGEMPPTDKLLLMRKDGSKVPVISTHTLIELGGKGPEFYCMNIDMTEQERLQVQLYQTRKMESIANLSGGIAHQFNNALATITGNLDLLEMDFPSDKNIAAYTVQMKNSAQRMIKLTNQLLAYARGGKYQAEIISLSDFVRNTIPLIKHNLPSSVHIDMDLSDGNFNIEADPTQMQMVLSAILTNSSEAIAGDGYIRVSCRNETIIDDNSKNTHVLKSGTYTSLTIEDNGKGMDEKTVNRVFEPFFTTKFQGRGLGMAAAYGIVKNHNGWIYVDSELGEGTKVNIYLPEIAKEKIPSKKIETEPVKGTGTILVIEDNEMVMDVTLTMLERLGYHVLASKTGHEAINVVKSYDGDIDLAILDIVLPDMEGDEVYPLLMEARPVLKVLVYSGYSIDGPAQDILDSGAEDFLQKPFSMAALSGKVKELLETKK